MKWTRTRAAGALAVGTASALVLSACGDDAAVTPSATVHEPVTLTVAYFSNFGFTEEKAGPSLESVYETAHPWVTLEMVNTEYNAHHDALTQSLLAGTGAPNVAAVDEGFIVGFVAQAENFVNLADLGALDYKDKYVPWKWDAAASADGNTVIGVGSDVGGLALCYRKDLFEAANIVSEREDVSAAVGDSWADFIALGEEYVAATGNSFVDNATNILNPAIGQLGVSYYNRNNELDMDAVKPAFDIALDVIDANISAGIGAWSDEWNAGFQNGDFATLPCPAWMLGTIESKIDPATFTGTWDIADIPGNGGNWGGSYYTVPNQGTAAQQQESWNFIEWIIQPAQQIKIMKETGNMPSQIAILQSDDVLTFTNAFFNDAPYGAIFAKTALDLPAIYFGPNNGAIRVAVEAVMNDVQAGNITIADAWDKAVEAAELADA